METRTGGSDVDVSKRKRTVRNGWMWPGLTALALLLCLRATLASPPASLPSPAAAASVAPVRPIEAAPSPSGAAHVPQDTSPTSAPATAASPRAFTPPDDGPREWIHGEDINWGRQITSTLVWLLLMCGAIWLILRFMYGRVGAGMLGLGGRRTIQVLERQFLGPQKALLTVRVGERVLLLGMTDHTITTLAELPAEGFDGGGAALEPMGPSRLGERAGPSEPPPDNLVDLASLFGRRGAQPSKGDDRE